MVGEDITVAVGRFMLRDGEDGGVSKFQSMGVLSSIGGKLILNIPKPKKGHNSCNSW